VNIRPAPCPEALWESLVRSDSSATFFETPAWHKLAEDFEGTRSAPLLFDFEGFPVVLPAQLRKRWWGALRAAPFGTYTTLLSKGEIPAGHLEHLARELSALNLEIPGSPFSDRLARLPGLSTRSAPPISQTRILRLEDLQPEAWVESWSRNHRRMLRAAQDTGATVRLAENAADVSGYYALYRAQTKRWGAAARRIYPEELFQEAFRRLAPVNSLRLWLAETGEGIVGGRLCLYHGSHAVEWHAAAEQKAMEGGINHLLVHAVVLRAREAGFKVYDFNPNPGLGAVDHFKRGFATETLQFRGLRNRAGLVGILTGLRARLHGNT
jgi:hypothetical protein